MTFQDYPKIFNYKLTEKMKEDFEETSTTPPSRSIIPDINQEFSKGPGLNKNIAGIIMGIILSFLLLLLSYVSADFNDYESDSIIYKMLIFAFIVAVFICIIFSISIGLKSSNRIKNIFNCNIIRGTDKSVLTIKDLEIDDSVLNKLKLNENNPICPFSNIQNDYFKIDLYNNSLNTNDVRILFLKVSFFFPSALLLILFYGIFFSSSATDFILYRKMKIIILLFLIITTIALIVSLNSIIKNNKMMYKSNDIQTFKNRIEEISKSDSRLTDEEKNKLYSILKSEKINENAIVVADTTDDLKKNKITKHSDDGIIIFIYIFTLAILLFVFISIVSRYTSEKLDTSIFDLSSNTKIKILLLFVLLIIMMVITTGITNPWLLNDDNKKSQQKTIILSTILPILFVIIMSVIITITNTV